MSAWWFYLTHVPVLQWFRAVSSEIIYLRSASVFVPNAMQQNQGRFSMKFSESTVYLVSNLNLIQIDQSFSRI